VRGYFGIGVYHPKHEVNIGTLWRHAMGLGAAFIFTIGERYHRQAADTPKTWKHRPLFHFATWEDFVEHQPYDCPLVCVELAETAHELPAFTHPERCVYLLGAEDHGLPECIMAGHAVVTIPGGLCYNVATAGTMVMYDRWLKREMA